MKFSTSLVSTAVLALATLGSAQAVTVGRLSGGSALPANAAAPSLVGPNLVLNVAGVSSFDEFDAPGNAVFNLAAAPGALVDGISYNLSYATIGESWLSEATIAFLNTDGDGVFLTFSDEDFSGSGTYVDSAFLADFGLTFNIGSDGVLQVQFFESFDDQAGLADGLYSAGNITFAGIAAVPEPSTYALMAFGVLGLGAFARRRRDA